MFNGYLAESGNLVTEECAPYKASTKGAHCGEYAKCSPYANIADSYFIEVSQTQDKVDDTKIMKELLRNGAVVGEFKAPNRFRYYDKGILVDEQHPSTAYNVQLDNSLES